MYREKIRDVESFKSDEFKGLKEKDEELLPGTRNAEAVRGVQNFLNEEGVRDSKGEELTVDGMYGANTANAVKNYQRANGLTVDGIVGDETWNSIYNRKKKREENASFEESLKSKSGGFFYDKRQNIRKAQRDLGINTGEEINEESDSKEDFHDRVRRRWERGKNPDLWNTPKIENFPYKPGTKREIRERKRPDREQMPWEAIREIQGRNIPNKTGEPWREKMPDAQAKPLGKYVPNRGQEPWNINAPRETKGINKLGLNNEEKKDFKTLGYAQFLGETGKPMNSYVSNVSSKSENAGTEEKDVSKPENITVTDADKNIINDGIGEKAGTALLKPDSQNIVNTDYRTYYDFGETPAKTVLSGELNDALEIAVKNNDHISGQVIKTTIDNVNSFDDSAITSVYYLNDEDGAMTAGHSGILMVNSEGKGILFSFYPQSQKFPDGLFYSPSEMRISVLSGKGLENFLNGSTVLSASTSGKKRQESYDRVLKYEITPEQGKAMFEQAVAIAGLNFSYDLAYRNCDHVALSILGIGNVDLWKFKLPNISFNFAVATALVSKLCEKVGDLWE